MSKMKRVHIFVDQSLYDAALLEAKKNGHAKFSTYVRTLIMVDVSENKGFLKSYENGNKI